MLKINDLELQEVSYKYEGKTLYLEFDVEGLTLQEIEEYFSLNENTIIEQYEGEILINKWYYKEFQSIGYEKAENGWHIRMSLIATCFQQNDLTSVYNLIDEKSTAITNLATSINLHEIQITNILNELQTINSALSQDNSTNDNKFISIQSALSRLESNYVLLANRIARLENNVNNVKTSTNNTTSNNNTNSDNNDNNAENTDTNVEDYDTSDNIEDDEFLDNDNN